jgi:hypothetical protein
MKKSPHARTNSDLLINESPLQCLPTLAKVLGSSDDAIVLQQVKYWLNHSKNVIDGRVWVYNTAEEWQEHFPWLSIKTIRRIFDRLEARGVILTACHNRDKWDRTKWYSIDIEALESLVDSDEASVSEEVDPSGQGDQMHVDKKGTCICPSSPDVIWTKSPHDLTVDYSSRLQQEITVTQPSVTLAPSVQSPVALAPSDAEIEEDSGDQQTLFGSFELEQFQVPTKSVPKKKEKEPRAKPASKDRAVHKEICQSIGAILPIKYPYPMIGKGAKLVLELAGLNDWPLDTIDADLKATYQSLRANSWWDGKEINPITLANQYRGWKGKQMEKLAVEKSRAVTPDVLPPQLHTTRQVNVPEPFSLEEVLEQQEDW